MPDLSPEVEAQLAGLSDGEWSVLSAKVRAPDTAEQLRTALSKHISGDRLESVLKVANPAAFVDGSGAVDEAKVERQLRTMFDDIPKTTPQHQNFGQYTQPPSTPGPGDRGKAEAAHRFGTNAVLPAHAHPEIAKRYPKGPSVPPSDQRDSSGRNGAAAAAKRFGFGKEDQQ